MHNKTYECDLHCHTTRSDGADTPLELIKNAGRAELKVLAITDHDIRPPMTVQTEDGRETDIVQLAKEMGIILLRGIEISCQTEVEDVHILCFGCDWSDPFFQELEGSVVVSKIKSYKELLKRLGECGMPVTWNEVLDRGGKPISEEHVQKKRIFEIMTEKGYVQQWSDAKLLVKNDRRLRVEREKPDPTAVIREVKRCGGICILAHPFLISEKVMIGTEEMNRDDYIERLIAAGLDGIEACYTYSKTSYDGEMSDKEIEDYIRTAYAERLPIMSGGSDYHADYKKGVKNPRRLGESGITFEYFQQNRLLNCL